jgi:hypothetical protein
MIIGRKSNLEQFDRSISHRIYNKIFILMNYSIENDIDLKDEIYNEIKHYKEMTGQDDIKNIIEGMEEAQKDRAIDQLDFWCATLESGVELHDKDMENYVNRHINKVILKEKNHYKAASNIIKYLYNRADTEEDI